MENNVALGADSIPAGVLKLSREKHWLQIRNLTFQFWEEKDLKGELRDATAIFKVEDKFDCGNHKGFFDV